MAIVVIKMLSLPHLRAEAAVHDPSVLSLESAARLPRSAHVTTVPNDRLRRIVEEHVDGLWRFIRRLGVFEGDVDDVLQEAIVILSSRLAEIPPDRERSFFFSTAFRVASDRRRRREARREVGDDVLFESEDGSFGPGDLLDRARARSWLDHVMESMPTDLRAVFVLYEVEEMTMAEIANLLDLPPGTVASRLRRARELFERKVSQLQLNREEPTR
jgi:RNA polymerase sigma-70 factor (ECF subfamily)